MWKNASMGNCLWAWQMVGRGGHAKLMNFVLLPQTPHIRCNAAWVCCLFFIGGTPIVYRLSLVYHISKLHFYLVTTVFAQIKWMYFSWVTHIRACERTDAVCAALRKAAWSAAKGNEHHIAMSKQILRSKPRSNKENNLARWGKLVTISCFSPNTALIHEMTEENQSCKQVW